LFSLTSIACIVCRYERQCLFSAISSTLRARKHRVAFHEILPSVLFSFLLSFYPPLLLEVLLARVLWQDVARRLPVERALFELGDDVDDLVDGPDPLLGRVSFTKGDGALGDG
jgi:hypothetical protein